GPAVLEPEPGDPRHQVKLGRPDVAVRRRAAAPLPVDQRPVVRGRDLGDRVVDRVDPHVAGGDVEDPAELGGGQPGDGGQPYLHHEPPAAGQVRGRVLEHRHLLVLGGDVHDRVEHQVYQRVG